ncbi:MAG: RcnB family protein [Hyphomonas sp.]
MTFRFTSAVLAAALCASLTAYADPPGHAKGDSLPHGLAKQGKVPPGHAKKLWARGDFLPLEYRDRDFADWRRYDLDPAPPGYRWVLVDDDAYLVQAASGLIAEALVDLLD